MTQSFEWIKTLADDEEAKPIKGHAGYFITNKGRVYSSKRGAGKWLVINPSHAYYYKVSLATGVSGGKSYNVHQLVGEHFCVSYNESYDEIGHLDETLPFPQINYATNLKPMTLSENRKDAFAKQRNRGNSNK